MDELTENELTVDELTVNELTVDELTWYLSVITVFDSLISKGIVGQVFFKDQLFECLCQYTGRRGKDSIHLLVRFNSSSYQLLMLGARLILF